MNNKKINHSCTEVSQILSFWRDLEIFTIPSAPIAKDSNKFTKIITLRVGEQLPWDKAEYQPTSKHMYMHTVYIGVADQEDLTRLVLRKIVRQELSDKERERISGTGWLASFTVNENGRLSEDSYMPASYVYGTQALSRGEPLTDLNARLVRAKEEFAQRCHRLSQLKHEYRCSWKDLEGETELVRSIFDQDDQVGLDWRFVVVTKQLPRKKIIENVEQEVNYLNSFYLDDLDQMLKKSKSNHAFGQALTRYLGPSITHHERIDILKNHEVMGKLVCAAHLPITRWPASPDKPLVLAQQAVVAHIGNLLGNQDGIIGVNGPPGTGKTTLLCDVIATVITDRAKRISVLSTPDAIFKKPIQLMGRMFSPIVEELVRDTSIVVSSNNNNAVKNISQELPALGKLDERYRSNSLYFPEVIKGVFDSQKVLDENQAIIPTWGIIAAALGNSTNRRSFARAFFKEDHVTESDDEDSKDSFVSMKQILEDAIPRTDIYRQEWHKAKNELLELIELMEQKRSILMKAERASLAILECRETKENLTQTIKLKNKKLNEHQNVFHQIQSELQDQSILMQSKQQILEQIHISHGPRLWDRLFALFGYRTHRMEIYDKRINEVTLSLQETTSRYENLIYEKTLRNQTIKICEQELLELNDELIKIRQEYERLSHDLQAIQTLGVKHLIGPDFWKLTFEELHRASVNTSEIIDDTRAHIFIKSIELYKLTILSNAKRFLSNLRMVGQMLSGNAKGLSYEDRPLIWDSLFFVVPVVSTTLASFSRLFAGLGQDSLGWLLIDEAGQATPQSAAGAIWRSKRAILIGDPLQVEPVFTLPDSVVEIFRKQHDVDLSWSPVFESVQTLADRITPLGSWIDNGSGDDQSRIWTGMPLRTHRRCDDPMFSIANSIAYAGQMVQGRVDSAGNPKAVDMAYDIGASTWFNVDSIDFTHPVNSEELDVMIYSLRKLEERRKASVDNSKKKIYVISPFRKVIQACKERIKDEGLIGVECGTVHTFQGKEADIVFLVLGTAKERIGEGARAWASSTPNLLNVAVTRAKSRLYIIGNVHTWSKMNYFSTLFDALPVKTINTINKSIEFE
ncbi:AAA domain-containing protein [Acinetobacter sp. V102_4]|uniref:DEAD/DEAH box helicase n=1 Tax=Acinetobacter sp. V102_4 TaxID=3072984 RepID=UPI00287CE355|nr:AAA domain-containing protein [Acinetobacter sp. V102_4]MDS7928359.1 AAA domain-containing protein [Acinetobacter sp. V102_4]